MCGGVAATTCGVVATTCGVVATTCGVVATTVCGAVAAGADVSLEAAESSDLTFEFLTPGPLEWISAKGNKIGLSTSQCHSRDSLEQEGARLIEGR